MNDFDLSKASTKALVDEISKREGVCANVVEPYQPISVDGSGPAIILVVVD